MTATSAMKKVAFSALVLAIALGGCTSQPPDKGNAKIERELTQQADEAEKTKTVTTRVEQTTNWETTMLEAEALTLTDAAVKELADASGGRAVFFGKQTSTAKGRIHLKRGGYQILVYMQSPDGKHDAFYLTVKDRRIRFFQAMDEDGNWVRNTIRPTESNGLVIDRDGPVPITLETAETGFYIDRIEFERSLMKEVPY